MFLDDRLDPFADQWRFLGGVERLDRARVDRLVAAASTREGGVLGVADETEEPDEPWRVGRAAPLPLVGPVPDEVRITLAQQVYIPREGLPPRLVDRIRRLAAFANPVFYERQRLRFPVGHVPRLIGCAEEHPGHIALPRGCLDDLERLLAESGVRGRQRRSSQRRICHHRNVHGRADHRAARCRGRASPTRDWSSRRAARRREDCDRNGVNRRAGGLHAGARRDAHPGRPVARAARDVPRHRAVHDRNDPGRAPKAWRDHRRRDDPDPRTRRRRRRGARVVWDARDRRVPPRPGDLDREGRAPRARPLRARPDRDTTAPRRPPADHPHAVRADPTHDPHPTVARPSRVAARHELPDRPRERRVGSSTSIGNSPTTATATR